MKKKSAIFISLLLCASLLGGCGTSVPNKDQGTGKSVSMESGAGRYMEQDWDASYLKVGLPIGYEKKDKESLKVFVTNNHRISLYDVDQEGQLTPCEIQWDAAARDILKTKTIEYIAVSPDENIYLLTLDIDRTNGKNYQIAKVQGSEIKEVPISWKKQMTNSVRAMAITENNKLMVLEAMKTINIYDLNTGVWEKEIGGAATQFIYDKGKVYEANIENKKIEVYELSSGNCIRSVEAKGIDAHSLLIKGDEEGSLYLISKEGVAYLSEDSDIWEYLVDGASTAFGSKEIYGAMNINGTIFAGFADTEAWVAYKKYVYDALAPVIPESKVTLFSLRENDALKEAIRLYSNEHPEVEVILNIAAKNNENMSTTDMIKALNTQLLTGQGADLIVLDGLPIEAYIKKGILADLNEYMEKEVKDEGILSNIVSGYEREGKQYALPLRFSIPVIMGEQEVVDQINSVEDIASYQKTHPEEQIITDQTAEELMQTMFSSSKSAWFNDKGELQKDKLKHFLEAIKLLATDESKVYQLKSEAISNSGFTDQTTESADYLNKKTELMMTLVNSPDMIQYLGYVQSQREKSVVKQWGNSSGQYFYMPRSVIGINAASEQKEAAAEILKIALSREGQIDISLNNLPVRRDILQYNVRGNNRASSKDLYFTYPDEKGNVRKDEFEWGHFDLVLQVEKMCKAANTPTDEDKGLYEILYAAAKDYLRGKGDVSAAVEQFAANCKVYFSE